jgi:hypothetical protein
LSPRRPEIAARKLSIARLSGNATGALAFGEVLAAGFERGFFEIGIPFLPARFSYRQRAISRPSGVERRSATRLAR